MPSVIETEKGDFIGIRSKIILSHSYDHRVVNGSLGSKFVKFVKEYLENWDTKEKFNMKIICVGRTVTYK